MAPHSSTLAWKIPWTEEPGGLQSMRSLRVRHEWAASISLFTFHFHALEKKMATHSSVLAWRIPGTGKPDGLPSMGSHRVGHHWSDLATAEEEKLALLLIMWYFACWLNDHCSSTAGPFLVDALLSLCFCGQKIEWSHLLRRPLILPSRRTGCTVPRTLYWGTTRSGYRVLFHHRWLNS